MGDVTPLHQRREAVRSAGLDKRYAGKPDAEILLWRNPDTGRLGQVYHTLDGVTTLGRENLERRHWLLDTMWFCCEYPVETDEADYRLMISVLLDNDGYINMRSNSELETGSTWRHSRWVLRQWWRVTKWWWKLAWRMWRHPQPMSKP